MQFFSVRDIKTDSFGTPFPSAHEAVAVRQLLTEVVNPQSALSRFPEDFELWYIGDFDIASGEISSTPRFLSSVSAIKAAAVKEVPNG